MNIIILNTLINNINAIYMSLELPVSIGEGIDKLSILFIKKERIRDGRAEDVKKEYGLLCKKLEIFITKNKKLYESMIKINTVIWDQMNILRDGNLTDSEYAKLCRKTVINNDIRFRIKNKINYITNSVLKEQKSYNIKRAIVEINNEEYNNSTTLLNIIKYLSLVFDETIINGNGLDNIKNIFCYDYTILYNKINENYERKYVINECSVSEDLFKIFGYNPAEVNKLI